MTAPSLHVVLVGRYEAAIHDWRDRLVGFNPNTLAGVDVDGRNIRFISAERPDSLRGLRISSWEQHSSTALIDRRILERAMHAALAQIKGGA